MNVRGEKDQEAEMVMIEELRRGSWTVEEDFALINCIYLHGEGLWDSLARSAGLKRTGKSCRLRWLNYLHPDVRRGNITLEEQLLILELHSRWGNRWSKIAKHLPGRTDNEIKNYWRTRVQKHAKQLKCEVNSKKFKDTIRYLWMPRLAEKMQAASTTTISTGISNTTLSSTALNYNTNIDNIIGSAQQVTMPQAQVEASSSRIYNSVQIHKPNCSFTSENSKTTRASSDSPKFDLTNYFYKDLQHAPPTNTSPNYDVDYIDQAEYRSPLAISLESLISPSGYYDQELIFQALEQQNNQRMRGDLTDSFCNGEDIWSL